MTGRGSDAEAATTAPAGVPGHLWTRLLEAIGDNERRPTRVAVMGQTGVGKSSLVNALFGSTLATGDVRPTTMDPSQVTSQLRDGRSLIFVDLPGIGESAQADFRYRHMYLNEIGRADIALWLFSAESRSVLTDVECLQHLAAAGGDLGKVTFALTKADLVTSPWIMSHDGNTAGFALLPEAEALLEHKASYVQEAVTGVLGVEPERPTVTSARFRYRLVDLLAGVLARTDDATATRLSAVLDTDALAAMPLQEGLRHRNLIPLDIRTNTPFDLVERIPGAA